MSVLYSFAASRGYKLAIEEYLYDCRFPKEGLEPASWSSILSTHLYIRKFQKTSLSVFWSTQERLSIPPVGQPDS